MPNRPGTPLALTFLLGLGCAPALAQTTDFEPLPTGPANGSQLVWDSVLQRVVACETTPARRLWDWDGSRWALQAGVPDPGAGSVAGAVYDPFRQVGVFLGISGTTHVLREWNGAQWTIRSSPLPTWPTGAALAFDTGRQRIVAIGASPNVHEWDGGQWQMITPANSLGPRGAPALAYDPVHQRCVAYGGGVGSGTTDCWSWDGTDWTLLASNAPPGSRYGASLAFEPSTGRLILYGGDPVSRTTWALQGSTWSQVLTTRDPNARYQAELVWDGQGLLLHGGSALQSGDTWRFQANDWQRVDTGMPAPRANAALAFDPVRGQTVLFGGNNSTSTVWFDDTWTFDGRWQHHASPVHPPAHSFASFVWSTPDQALLLFGGDPTNNDTWTWNGSQWQQRTPPNSPPPRHGQVMAQDPAGGVLLFGGVDATGQNFFGDHWYWNGSNWLAQTPAVLPGPRAYALAAYDPLRNVVVLAAGTAGPSLQDTWEWNGTQWAQQAPAPFFISSRISQMVFRPDTGRVLARAFDYWEWDGTSWTAANVPNDQDGTARFGSDLGRGRVLRFSLQNGGLGVLTATAARAARYGNGCAIGPAPGTVTLGRPTPGATGFALATSTFAANAPLLQAIGLGTAALPLGSGCSQLVGQILGVTFAVSSPAGYAQLPLPIPADNTLRGVAFTSQTAVVDGTRGLFGGFTLTDGLRITIGD